MKRILFYLPLMFALAFILVGCDKDETDSSIESPNDNQEEEVSIDPRLVGRWKLLIITYGYSMKADTTIVSNEQILEITSEGHYWKTVDGTKEETKKLQSYQGKYKDVSISENLIRTSDNNFFIYLLSKDNNCLALKTDDDPYIIHVWEGYHYTYYFQRIN